MSLTRRFAAAAAVATVATLGFGISGANAAPADPIAQHDSWDGQHHDDSLLNVSENNVGPVQVCNNNIPVNVLGVQVPVSDLAGVVGFGNDGNTAGTVKNCDQASLQDN